MALVPDQKFSTFHDGGDLEATDIVVGLRGGINTRFVYTGELPPGVIVPVINGGTGRAAATAYALIAGGTTPTGPLQSLTLGSSGQLLQSNGAGALPTWTTSTFPIGPGTLNHLLRSDGTNWVETTNTTIDASDVMSSLSQLLIGTATPLGASQLQIAGVSAVGAGLISTYKNDTNGSALNMTKSRSTTVGTKTTIVNGDDIGLMSFFGDDGTSFTEGARIRVTATGAVSAGIVPTSFRLSTMNTSGVLTLGMTLSNAQILTLANPLPLTSGGTNASLTASNGGIVYSTATAMAILAGTPTAGKILQSGASSAPSWSTATFPSGSGTLNHLLRSDGTNWVETTNTTIDSSDVLNGLSQVFIGATTSIGSNQLQVFGVNTIGATSIASFINTSASPPALRLVKSRSIVVGSHVTVQNGDSLGSVSHFGDDGTNFVESARIGSFVTGAVSTGIVPTEYRMFTMNTSGVLTQAMSISNAQVLTLVNALLETSGGTGQATYTLGDTLYSSTTNTLSKLSGNTTAVKQYLSQTGTGAVSAAPVWATISGSDITGAALTKTDDTNVTLTLGGTPTTALLRAASLTLGWTGTLSGTRGGTGVNNGASTITLGGSLTTSGAFASTFTMTNTTSVTFPTSGTLATTSQIPTGSALTKTDDTNVTLTLGGSPTTALVNAASLTLGWTGQLGLTRGGTAASLTASNGGIVYSGASALAILSGTATAGQHLQSGASGAPSWTTATFPATATATGTILRADGTNWVASTSTYPNTNAINTLLYASSANVMAALATANSSVLVTSSGGVPSLSTALPSGLTATNMNLTTPTLGVASATSINFGGTALSTYTEGTWTPTDSSGAALSFTSVVGRYTRIGRLVIAQATLTFPVTADATQNLIGSLPFTVANNNGALGGSVGFNGLSINNISTQPLVNTATCRLYTGNTPLTNVQCSTGTFYFTQIYTV